MSYKIKDKLNSYQILTKYYHVGQLNIFNARIYSAQSLLFCLNSHCLQITVHLTFEIVKPNLTS